MLPIWFNPGIIICQRTLCPLCTPRGHESANATAFHPPLFSCADNPLALAGYLQQASVELLGNPVDVLLADFFEMSALPDSPFNDSNITWEPWINVRRLAVIDEYIEVHPELHKLRTQLAKKATGKKK